MNIELPSLYAHQVLMKDRSRAALTRDRRVILCAPPGTGKTRLAKWILGASANRVPNDNQTGKVLFAVQKRGLVDNASNSFLETPELPHGVVMSGSPTAWGERVQVASIDTLLSWFVKPGGYDSNITFDLIVYDECISGDSLVETNLGQLRIDQIPTKKPDTVLSWSKHTGLQYSRILNWKHSGVRETISIHTHAGKIRCTPDHEIYTRRGWLQAQYVSPSDEVLACAVVGVAPEKGRCSHGGTRKGLVRMRMMPRGTISSRTHRYADVAAKRRSVRRFARRLSGSRADCQPPTISSQMVTRTAPRTRQWFSQTLRRRPSLGRSLGILRSAIRTHTLVTRVYRARTVTSSMRGRSTKLNSCIVSTPRLASQLMMGMETCLFARSRRAIHALRRYTNSHVEQGRNECRGNGSTESVISDSHGGYVMTGVQAGRHSFSTHRRSHQSNATSLPDGFATDLAEPLSADRKAGMLSTYPATHRLQSENECLPMSLRACSTSWSRVTRIVHENVVDVYDIEVEGTHCFFANGLLVHNCHSHLPKLTRFLNHHDQMRMEQGKHPAYVLGLTATPQCKGLADVYADIIPGPPPQWLIDNHFLSPFKYLGGKKGRLGQLIKRGGEFTKSSVDAAFAGMQGDMVRDWLKYAAGRPTVGFFPRRSHAKEAQQDLIKAGLRTAYVDGDTSDEERHRIFWELDNRKLDYLCNVQVVERGTDIPAIACVQLCVAIGSLTRYLQMIGRGSRVHSSKADCLVLDHGGNVSRHGLFEDDQHWSLDMSRSDSDAEGSRPTIECPQCSAIYRGGRCRECGYEPTLKERTSQGLEFDGEELRPITKKSKDNSALDPQQLMCQALFAAGQSGRSWKQAVGIFYRECEKQGKRHRVPKTITIAGHRYRMLPSGHPKGGRQVAALFPVTVKKGHGGEFDLGPITADKAGIAG